MERIEGMISDIVFKNEDNGYTIAHLANSDNEIVIVGCMPTLSVGESIEVEGKWINHKTYGTQFEVEKFMPVTPSSLPIFPGRRKLPDRGFWISRSRISKAFLMELRSMW